MNLRITFVLTILFFLFLSIGCGQNERPTVPKANDNIPVRELAGDGTEMGSQELLIYFTSHLVDSYWGYDHPCACGLWEMIYDSLLQQWLIYGDSWLKGMVDLQEAGGMDVPDELDIESPC